MTLSSASEIEAIEKKVAGSSFYSAMRLMPKAERDAMFAIYAFCRAVDDIADDGEGTRPERAERLARWRRDLDALYKGGTPVLSAFLAPHVRGYGLRQEDFLAVIDGMDMDVEADIRAPDRATLDLYCDRVACAVGRLSVRVFGMQPEAGLVLAHHLGRALQLTNILRDLDEDAAMGRLYLPREVLREAGIISTDPATVLANPMLGVVCDTVVGWAREHFLEARAIMAKNPRRVVRAPRIMGDAYRAILDKLTARGFMPPRPPVRHSKVQLLFIVARNLV
jgi:presqualene diphosphate synthase